MSSSSDYQYHDVMPLNGLSKEDSDFYYNEGYDDFEDGEECPYKQGTPESEAWWTGFTQAEEEWHDDEYEGS